MKKIHIFISSPGDVQEEREKAREVVKRLQRRYIGRMELKSVLWEDLALTADMSFQQGIERVLSKDQGIDIAVFILWSRLGSPLGARVRKPDGSEYRSGTEREFDLMMQAREEASEREETIRPAILAYIRDDEKWIEHQMQHRELMQNSNSTDMLKKIAEQRDLVKQFITEKFYDAESGNNIRAFHSFDTPSTFSHRLRVHLQSQLDEFLQDSHFFPRTWDVEENGAPYRGLETFDVAHEDIYFGREQEIADVQIALQHQARKGQAFVLIVGASGSGKSSMARAGVIPALQNYDTDPIIYRYGILTPGQYPENLFRGLAGTICAITALPEITSNNQSIVDLSESLKNDPESAYNLSIKPALEKVKPDQKTQARLILLVDQLEELFTHTEFTPDTVTAFAKTLQVLARSGNIWVLSTLRSDFYANLQQYPELIALKEGQGQYDLLAFREGQIHRIVTEPAWMAGLNFEENPETGERLDQRILNYAIGHAEALPLLEYTLRELFENRSTEGALTFKAYEELGGVEGALGKRAEETYAQLSKPAQNFTPTLFRFLVTVDEMQAYTSRPMILDDIFDQDIVKKSALENFIKARLLISHKNENDQVVVRIAHEAMIRSWRLLNQWVQDAKEFLKARAHLDVYLKHWIEKGSPDDLLLPEGSALEEAKDLNMYWREELSSKQVDYIERSTQFQAKTSLEQGLNSGDRLEEISGEVKKQYPDLWRQVLSTALSRGSVKTRKMAIKVLSSCRDGELRTELIERATEDHEETVRYAVAQALVVRDDYAAFDELSKVEPRSDSQYKMLSASPVKNAFGRVLAAADVQKERPIFADWFEKQPVKFRIDIRLRSYRVRFFRSIPTFFFMVIPAMLFAVVGAASTKWLTSMFNYSCVQATASVAMGLFHSAPAGIVLGGGVVAALTLFRMVFGKEYGKFSFFQPMGSIVFGMFSGLFAGIFCVLMIAGVYAANSLQGLGWLSDGNVKPEMSQVLTEIFLNNRMGWVFPLTSIGTGIGMSLVANGLRASKQWKRFLDEQSTLSSFDQLWQFIRGIIRISFPLSLPLPLFVMLFGFFALVVVNQENSYVINSYEDVFLGGVDYHLIQKFGDTITANKQCIEWKKNLSGRALGIFGDGFAKVVGGYLCIVGMGVGIIITRHGLSIEARKT